ncbi:spindle and kinetochore-associated protein 1 [Clarias gariepinus]|uniref:spindle and kinetochore-associated protein 1 n=1 Tax=Clarias gariepinus TaxID=13013 RepID=UPI00234DC1B4|nr:spindle and kinetochore-associated protein 1 [Clarias gariepinus]
MNHCELEEVTKHINDKLSLVKRLLDLRAVAKDPDKRAYLLKIEQDVNAINGLLDRFERCVIQQRDLLNHLQDLDMFFQEDEQNAQHLLENIPPHMPRKGGQLTAQGGQTEVPSKQSEVNSAPQEQEQPRKPSRSQIKEMEFITVQEFDNIPQYMKGRVTYDQLNTAVKSINTAVTGKYKILQQPVKSLSNAARKLHQRFKDQETKDTKGQFFVVEEDLRDLAQLKVDKRFVGMLNMLRHCQRLKELRGGGLTRYMLL